MVAFCLACRRASCDDRAMARCTTRSGRWQCDGEEGHAGVCETTDGTPSEDGACPGCVALRAELATARGAAGVAQASEAGSRSLGKTGVQE